MSKWVNNLHQENSRLRNEINKLKGSLREVKSSLGSKSPITSSRVSKSPNSTSREKESNNIKKNLEKDLFNPVGYLNEISSNSIKSKISQNSEIKKSAKLVEKLLENSFVSEKDLKYIKNIDKPTPVSQKSKILRNSNRNIEYDSTNNIENNFKESLLKSCNIENDLKESPLSSENMPKIIKKIEEKNDYIRPLKESFESYYESEEENLSKYGKRTFCQC